MKILMAHLKYLQAGGEDIVFDNECELLRSAGIDLVPMVFSNEAINDSGIINKLKLGMNSVWSLPSYRSFRKQLQRHRPDVVHFHNTFPLLSPSVYNACYAERIPVVQTLHNFRMICPGATLFRNGELCEECLESGVVHSIQYGCYRGSKAATAAVVAMIQVNRLARNYSKASKYIALTNFAAEKLIEGGFPEDKIVVKSNFLNNPPEPNYEVGDYLLYIGRLSEEKGVYILLQALASISVDIPLKIAGDGPDRKRLEKYCVDNQLSVEFLGHQNKESLYQYMKLSSMIVMPSLWYEGFPIVLLEAYACGKPVVASRIGSLDELVIEGKTGRKFTPGSPQELARVIRLMMADADLLKTMGVSARSEYDDKYSKKVNIKSMMKLYEGLLENKNQ